MQFVRKNIMIMTLAKTNDYKDFHSMYHWKKSKFSRNEYFRRFNNGFMICGSSKIFFESGYHYFKLIIFVHSIFFFMT